MAATIVGCLFKDGFNGNTQLPFFADRIWAAVFPNGVFRIAKVVDVTRENNRGAVLSSCVDYFLCDYIHIPKPLMVRIIDAMKYMRFISGNLIKQRGILCITFDNGERRCVWEQDFGFSPITNQNSNRQLTSHQTFRNGVTNATSST